MDLNIIRAIHKESKDAKPIQELCNEILEQYSTLDPETDAKNCNSSIKSNNETSESLLPHLKISLELFTLSSRHWSNKRHPLVFDFLRTTLRKINELSENQSLKNETISKIITVFGTFSEQKPQQSQIVIDICSVLVEIATNFATYLTIQQTIEIIEICHDQIRLHIVHNPNNDNCRDGSAKKAFLHHLQALQSKLRPSTFGSQNQGFDFQDPNLEFENFILSDDTVLSAINLAGSQICHAFTKNRIISGGTRISSSSGTGSGVSSQESRTRAQVAQDFAHVLAYLSHKLKMKQSFWHTLTLASKNQNSSTGSGTLSTNLATVNESSKSKEATSGPGNINQPSVSTEKPPNSNWNAAKKTAEYFVLVKVYNCFYLKCIHYTMLTIPDAWPLMSSQLIEIVCRNVTPILMDILIPMSRLSGVKRQSSNPTTQSDIGRGSENLANTSGNLSSTSYQTLVKTVAYQERNSIYKISLELLRLFGLERSMRPLLEALFHRIFLLPNNEQRVESLVFMQDVLRNPLLVLVLMSNPLCLYGFSSSHSGSLDLFKIFIDAISEAQHSGHSLLIQLSTLNFAILMSTLDTLVKLDTVKSLEFLSSPTSKMILSYAQQNRLLYEVTYLFQNSSNSNKYKRTKQNQVIDDLQNIKARIYGYDSKNSEYICSKKQVPIPSYQESKGYFLESFNYSSRLNSLLEKQQQQQKNNLSGSSADTMSANLIHLSLENLDRFSREREYELFECSGTLRTAQSDDALWCRKRNSVSRPFVEKLHRSNSEQSVFLEGSKDLHINALRSSSSSSSTPSSLSESSSSSSLSSKFMIRNNRRMRRSRTSYKGDDRDKGRDRDKNGDKDEEDNSSEEAGNSATIAHFERSLAAIFIRKLRELLPELVKKQSLLLADDILQSFASNYCRDLYRALKILNSSNFIDKSMDSPTLGSTPTLNDLTREEISILQASAHLVDSLFVNADGIYLAIYSVLLLNLKLLYRDYYETRDPSLIPSSEKEFIDEIYDYRIAIYLSPHFLAEIYQRIVDESLLDFLSIKEAKFESIPLIKLLQDVDVLDENKPNAYKLSEYARLEATMQINAEKHASSEAMCAIVRRFLAHFWNNFLELFQISSSNSSFSSPQNFKQAIQILSNVNKSHFSILCSAFQVQSQQQLSGLKPEDASLLAMHNLLTLSLQVNFYHEMDRLYDHFIQFMKRTSTSGSASSYGRITKSTTLPDLGDRVFSRVPVPTSKLSSTGKKSDALSPVSLYCIKALLNNSASIGSHCSKIWPRVFELCTFVLELETSLFRSSHSTLLSRARVSIGTILKSNSISQSLSTSTSFAGNKIAEDRESSRNDDFRSFAHLPGISENESLSLETQFDALISSLIRHGSGLELVKNSSALEQLVEFLSYFVGQIFESFALKFNLALLGVFVEELCVFSREQLTMIETQNCESINVGTGTGSKTLMLFRLVEVLLRFVRNGRPLLHFMRIWPTAAGHLIECCTFPDSGISKRAITSLHDIINAALSAYGEPDFFNFNESIFSCYEKLLLHELCDSESSEELLLNSICEFVEGASTEIRSGWRPIFRALKGLRAQLDSQESSRIALLSDIFDAYLRTENLHVFSYASADFVACAFHLVRGAANAPIMMRESTFITLLKYIQRFCKILRTINAFSDVGQQNEQRLIVSPLIRGRKYKLIQLDRLRRALFETLSADKAPKNRNRIITNEDKHLGSNLEEELGDDCEEEQNLDTVLAHFDLNLQLKANVKLTDLVDSSRPTPLLQLWSLILEEFANTITFADLHHRPMLLEVFFPLLGTCSDLDSSRQFVIFIANHIVMPLMQNLLSETLEPSRCTDIEANCEFLKQWLPVFVRHILRHVKSFQERNSFLNDACILLLKQCLLVTIECLNPDFHDLISWLALSLFHDILNSEMCSWINSSLWTVIIDCFQIGHQLTLSPLKNLVNSFENIPLENDLERLKVLSLRIERSSKFVRAKANQVFFVEPSGKDNKNGRNLSEIFCTNLDVDEKRGDDRDFHIIVESNSGVQRCVPFNQLTRQTHSHHYLTRIIVHFLTYNLSPSPEMLSPLLFGSGSPRTLKNTLSDSLNVYQYQRLCTMFKASRDYSIQFDRRPGLKFLIQQICQSKSPANLYQLSVMTWIVQFVVDFRFAVSDHEFAETIGELFQDCFVDYKDKLEFRQQLFGKSAEGPLTFSMLPLALLKSEPNSANNTPIVKTVLEAEAKSDQETNSSSESPIRSLISGSRANPFDDTKSGTIQLQLFSDNNLNQILGDFRRSKDLFNSPSVPGSNSKAAITKIGDKDIKDCFLSEDFVIYFNIWNEIFANCISLHASLPNEQFYLVLTQFRILFRHLFMIGDVSPEIRRSMQVWIDKIVELLLSKN